MSLESVMISSVMRTDVKTTTESQSLQQVCKVMQMHNIGSVIILADDNQKKTPNGIITERDVVNHLAIDPSHSQFTARQIMSHPVVTIAPNASLKDALRLLVSKDIRRLVVVQDSELVGILTDRDIYRLIAKNESLVSALISDEELTRHSSELQQPWVYKLGDVLHKRL